MAAPPRIGTNIMMVMREDLPTGRQACITASGKTETSIVPIQISIFGFIN
jgi:hypothetical protein